MNIKSGDSLIFTKDDFEQKAISIDSNKGFLEIILIKKRKPKTVQDTIVLGGAVFGKEIKKNNPTFLQGVYHTLTDWLR